METENHPTNYPKIKLLSLNLFLRPPAIRTNSTDHKAARTSYFLDNIISKYDIVCLQEVFTSFNYRRNTIKKEAQKKGFQYYVESPNPG